VLLLIVAAALLLLAVGVVSYPLLFQPPEPYAPPGPPPPEFSERDALLDAMDDLEHAFYSGKLSPHDYQAQRAALEARYVAVLEAAEAAAAARRNAP
jgi:hypothetical protein